MESLLDKFDSLSVEAKDKVAPEDLAYCEKQQRLYREAITIFEGCLSRFKAAYACYEEDEYRQKRGFISDYNDIRPMERRMPEIQQEFISNICRFFSHKYNVSIGTDFGKKKYDLQITYDNILEEIFIQLDGMTFAEKAARELKDKFLGEVNYGYSRNKASVKKNVVTLDGYVWVSKDYAGKSEISYSSRDRVVHLLDALSHFEKGCAEMLWPYSYIMRDAGNESVFCKHEIPFDKVTFVRLFKNGKVEIGFASPDLAERFLKEYCGVTAGA